MLSKYRGMKREQHRLSTGQTEEILSVLREVLEPRDVHKIVIESGHPMLVYRQKSEEADPLEEEDISLDGAIRNSDMIEYDNQGASSFEIVHDMFYILLSEGMNPVCWATGPEQGAQTLEGWLKLEERGLPRPKNMDNLLGQPVFRLKTLPQDTILLCGSSRDGGEAQDVEFVIKATVEMRDKNEASRSIDRPVGNGQERDPTPADEVGSSARRGDEDSWNPASIPRVWVGDG